ncbi:hypothetical protein ABG067_002363 [Albugo candida]
MTLNQRRLSISNANALKHFNTLRSKLENKQVVIFLDYDGTLSPIVNDPLAAILSPETRQTIAQLNEHFVTGIITGRSLSKIQEFVQLPQLYYAGSHGFDIAGPNNTSIKNQVAVEFLKDLEALRDALKEGVQGVSGAQVEDNLFSISLHYRNVDPMNQQKIADLAHEVGSRYPSIRCNQGKMVFEYKPKMDWNKGKALLWLLHELKLDNQDDVYTIYIGDDTTDEDAFCVLNDTSNPSGVGILVSDHSKVTGASYTLQDTNEVRVFLNELVKFGRG